MTFHEASIVKPLRALDRNWLHLDVLADPLSDEHETTLPTNGTVEAGQELEVCAQFERWLHAYYRPDDSEDAGWIYYRGTTG